MLPVSSGRRALLVALAVLVAVTMATPAWAQSTGMCKGKVVDREGKPVEGAKVIISFKDGISRTYEVKSNKKGEFIQIGLPPGNYKVSAEKEKLGAQSFDVRVRLGEAAEVNFVLAPGAAGVTMTKEEAAKAANVKKLFDEGVAASRSSDNDGAIAKFSEALVLLPNCYDCYYNIGFAHAQKKEFDKAEQSFQKALELKPDYVEAYNGLATIYNSQKKFEDAQKASQKAAELAAAAGPTGATGGVDALYNQGVINWNAGKAEEAKANFEAALKIKPDHADSHYQLGMCYVNLGKLAEAAGEFEEYLKLAPDGQYAGQAKSLVATLKK
ncbi:MAG: tetratricopeptide repeat protein [Acidobacteria bacterium]|nr:MAG: tetratricopeptide repeat protein [Acidobacteriota bacterium]RPJ84289.1 MAG: tetratricopeptide repeat protein [Acidobacteriota bacterium]